ncbi:hypothetical protein [Acidimangrovimonas sediminis]|uniref:hypothetical protein n=1 Tax=Acidimangrovimonas sediminis TaxID=2056283 RepID=UPI0013048CAB|nr:hypothetical protein [Acidimangrovimonas sediminis]
MSPMSRFFHAARSSDTPEATPPAHMGPPPAQARMVMLDIVRLMLQSYDCPARDGWMRGLALAEAAWGPARGARVFAELARCLDAMRRARRSPYLYANPDCAHCGRSPTPHEELLLQCLGHALHGREAEMAGAAMLLCEANPCAPLLVALQRVAAVATETAPEAETAAPQTFLFRS